MQTIQYENRDMKVKPQTVRKAGKVPAVFYGPKEKSTPIALKQIEFKKIWDEAGESSIIVLKGTDGAEHEALIHDVDIHPVTGSPEHVDFYVIEKGKKLQIKVPLEFTGTAPAVKDLGGILVKVLHEVEIEAMPKDLPREITVDTTALATMDSQILAKDLSLPAGVTLLTNADDVVAAVAEVKEEVEVAPVSLEDIEVVGAKGKEEPAPGEEGATEAKPAKAEKAE